MNTSEINGIFFFFTTLSCVYTNNECYVLALQMPMMPKPPIGHEAIASRYEKCEPITSHISHQSVKSIWTKQWHTL